MIEIIPNWHPIFVHYAVALPTVAAVAYVIAQWAKVHSIKYHAWWIGRWALWVGAVFVLLAVLAGLFAFYTVNHDSPSHIAMTEHRLWALLTAPWIIGLAGWAYWLVRNDKEESKWFVYAAILGAVLLTTTAWHGAELVYRYGLGVISLPVPEGEGHDHDHGDGGGHEHGDAVAPAESAPHAHDESDGRMPDAPPADNHIHAEPHDHAEPHAQTPLPSAP